MNSGTLLPRQNVKIKNVKIKNKFLERIEMGGL